MPKPSEILDTPAATGFSRVGWNEKQRQEFGLLFGASLNYDQQLLEAIWDWHLTTKDQEKKEAIGRILALKINMPSEREYSTNPTSAYRTGFEQAVSIYRDRIKSLTHRG